MGNQFPLPEEPCCEDQQAYNVYLLSRPAPSTHLPRSWRPPVTDVTRESPAKWSRLTETDASRRVTASDACDDDDAPMASEGSEQTLMLRLQQVSREPHFVVTLPYDDGVDTLPPHLWHMAQRLCPKPVPRLPMAVTSFVSVAVLSISARNGGDCAAVLFLMQDRVRHGPRATPRTIWPYLWVNRRNDMAGKLLAEARPIEIVIDGQSAAVRIAPDSNVWNLQIVAGAELRELPALYNRIPRPVAVPGNVQCQTNCLCVVCMVRPCKGRLRPCGHGQLCVPCALQLQPKVTVDGRTHGKRCYSCRALGDALLEDVSGASAVDVRLDGLQVLLDFDALNRTDDYTKDVRKEVLRLIRQRLKKNHPNVKQQAIVVWHELLARLHRETLATLSLPTQLGRGVLVRWAWETFGEEIVKDVQAGRHPAAEAMGSGPTSRPADGPRMQQLAAALALASQRHTNQPRPTYGDPPLVDASEPDVLAALVPDWAGLLALVYAPHWSDGADEAAMERTRNDLVTRVVQRLEDAVVRGPSGSLPKPLTLVNLWLQHGESLRLELGVVSSGSSDEDAIHSGVPKKVWASVRQDWVLRWLVTHPHGPVNFLDLSEQLFNHLRGGGTFQNDHRLPWQWHPVWSHAALGRGRPLDGA